MTEKFDKLLNREDEIKRIFESSFNVDVESDKSLSELMGALGLENVDKKITDINYPIEKVGNFSAKIEKLVRDEFVEDVNVGLEKKGLRQATLYEFLQFLPQLPGIVERIYALGSIIKEGDRKFCIKYSAEDGLRSLSLEELGSEK